MKKINYLLTLYFFASSILFGQESRTLLGHSGNINCLSFSPDGKTLMSGASDEKIFFWDVEAGKKIQSVNSYSNTTSAKYSKDGKYIVLTGLEYGCLLYDVASAKYTTILESKKCLSASISNDSKYICVTYFNSAEEEYWSKTFKQYYKGVREHYLAKIYSLEDKMVIKDLELFNRLETNTLTYYPSYRSLFLTLVSL